MSRARTEGILVEVQPVYLPSHSAPEQYRWVFAYVVTITNESERTVQLLSRHWVISNARYEQEEVRGPGVIGETPILEPGESFRYQSFCPLNTPVGSMEGTYQMLVVDAEEGATGRVFDAEIAPFTLAVESELN